MKVLRLVNYNFAIFSVVSNENPSKKIWIFI